MSVPYLQTATVVIDIVKALGTGGVLAVLLGSTGLGGVVTAYVAWKKQPVERRDADLAVAEASQGMSLELARELRDELDRMGSRIDILETKLDQETKRREQLETEVREQRDLNYRLQVVIARVQDAIEYVTNHWARIRQDEEPPRFPSLKID